VVNNSSHTHKIDTTQIKVLNSNNEAVWIRVFDAGGITLPSTI
jgi:hypothetical protein